MPKRVRTGLRIPYEMNTELIFIAQQIGVSKNALILHILDAWIKQKEKK